MKTVICVYKPCDLRQYPTGYVCVCNETYCDTTDVQKPKKFGEYIIVTSTEGGQRFNATRGFFVPNKSSPKVFRFERSIDENVTTEAIHSVSLTVDREKQFQNIVGFGGAFTGTVSLLFDLMPISLRHSLYRSYYAQDEGMGYTMMRIPIGGCDFDLEPWAYNENPAGDIRLDNFTHLDARDLHRIDQINELKQVANIDEIKFVGR